MGTGKASPTPALLLALVVLAQAIAAALLVLTIHSSHPVGARLAIVAPPVVSTALVDQAAAVPRHPFEASATDSAARALGDVRAGRTDAAIIVDLTRDTDTLYVSGASGPQGRAAIVDAVARVSSGLGRGVHTVVVPTRSDRHWPYVVVLVSLVLGFAAAVVATWIRGTFETRFRAAATRFAAFCALGIMAGLVLVGQPWRLRLLVAVLVLAAAVTTTALEALLGLAGIATSSLLFVLTAAPLGRFTPLLLVPQPWHAVLAWLPHGSGLSLATDIALFGGPGGGRSWALVTAWIVIPTLTLTVARVRRPS